MASLTERYEERIAGVLSCYDRVVVTGTLPGACYAEGMTRFPYANKIRIFDYPQFAATLRDRVRAIVPDRTIAGSAHHRFLLAPQSFRPNIEYHRAAGARLERP